MLKVFPSSLAKPERQLEQMAALFRYWEALPGDRDRRHVDPLALGSKLLPHVSLGSLIQDCTDFRYELISSELKLVAPRLRSGSKSSDALRIQGTRFDLAHDLFLSTGRTIEPKVLRMTYASMEGMSRGINTLFLPLGRRPGPGNEDIAKDLMIGLWRFEPNEPVKQDRYEDISSALAEYRASRENKGSARLSP